MALFFAIGLLMQVGPRWAAASNKHKLAKSPWASRCTTTIPSLLQCWCSIRENLKVQNSFYKQHTKRKVFIKKSMFVIQGFSSELSRHCQHINYLCVYKLHHHVGRSLCRLYFPDHRSITDVSHKMCYMIRFVLRNITDLLMIVSHVHLIHSTKVTLQCDALPCTVSILLL